MTVIDPTQAKTSIARLRRAAPFLDMSNARCREAVDALLGAAEALTLIVERAAFAKWSVFAQAALQEGFTALGRLIEVAERTGKRWRIRAVREVDDETGAPLYWNNGVGWCLIQAADTWSDQEREDDRLRLPIGGAWELI